jgi:hypothetical protein
MYYDQEFYNQMEIDDQEELSTRSNTRKVKKFMEPTSDKHSHKILGKNKKSIVVYTSGDSGSHIRNAVTGATYGGKHIVGSAMEDMYFRVGQPVGNELKKLFFDSPDQYEKHYGANVEKEVINGVEIRREWSARALERQLSIKR